MLGPMRSDLGEVGLPFVVAVVVVVVEGGATPRIGLPPTVQSGPRCKDTGQGGPTKIQATYSKKAKIRLNTKFNPMLSSLTLLF